MPLYFQLHGTSSNHVRSFQCSDKLGLSLELGSFVAGVMISTTDFAQHTLDQVCFCEYILSLIVPDRLCWSMHNSAVTYAKMPGL